jgi:hypothetical protein
VDFDAATETQSFDFKACHDSSGRTAAFVEISATLRGHVTTGTAGNTDTSTDPQMLAIRHLIGASS